MIRSIDLEKSTIPATDSSSTGGPLDLDVALGTLRQTASAASGINLRPFEEGADSAVREGLVPRVIRLGGIGREVIGDLFETFEDDIEPSASPEEEGDFFRDVDQLMASGPTATQRLADLCFLARMELGQRLQGLSEPAVEASHWMLLAQCDRCLRGLKKSVSAVENALCGLLGLEPQLSFRTELQTSLETREAYRKLRTELCGSGEPEPSQLLAHLRRTGASMAKLIGRDVFGKLRVNDRVELLRLQARILEWLRRQDPDPDDGRHLWQDVVAFTDLLMGVNNRSDLLEHDGREIERLFHALNESGSPHEAPPDSLVQQLRVLLGRHHALDRLVIATPAAPIEDWLDAVTQVAAELRVSLSDA